MNKDNYIWIVHMLKVNENPCLILATNGSIYYFGNREVSKESVIEFIEQEKKLNESHPIPPKLNFVFKGLIMIKISIYYLNEYLENLLNKYKIKFKCNIKFTLIVIGIFLFLFIKLQIFIVKSLCMRNKKNEEEKIKKEEKINNENIKEIKKEKNN